MKKIYTDSAPAVVGPYSQAIVHNGLVYTSGQIAIDPSTNTLITWWVEVQTKRVLANLDAVLEEAGASKNTVIKTTIFIKNMDDYSLVNAVYAVHFWDHAPARSCVEVARLPLDVLVEIECIAVVSH